MDGSGAGHMELDDYIPIMEAGIWRLRIGIAYGTADTID